MEFMVIEKLLQDTIGLNIESLGEKFMDRVVSDEMKRLGITSALRYREILDTSPEELDRLIEQAVVHETWFFRDAEPFRYLSNHVRENWLPARQGKVLRILSAACSTGEEPYSIAMTLIDAGLSGDAFTIDAVDISKEGLEKAAGGLYGRESFRGKTEDFRDRYFGRIDQKYKLDDSITGLVRFHRDNLVHPDYLAGNRPYEIIFCRNFMIYLTDKARETVLATINRLLLPGGLLFVGSAELFLYKDTGYESVHHSRSFALQKTIPAKKPAAEKKHLKTTTGTTKVQSTSDKKIPAKKIIAHSAPYTNSSPNDTVPATISKNASELCWEETGVYGNKTCTKLDELSHCRACPIYARYGKSLFDREIPPEYLKERTEILSRKKRTEIPGTDSVVVFRISDEWLALRIAYFEEVNNTRPVHSVPFRTNSIFRGLVNINGELIPCVSIETILGIPAGDGAHSTENVMKRMAVVEKNGERFVFSVNEVLGVRRITPDDLTKTPATISKSSHGLTGGLFTIDERTVGLLDEDRFFDSLQESIIR
ncbi:chemotaxis protein CheW [bacterium]|nr:chemotaxis protein CheW [bacterium]